MLIISILFYIMCSFAVFSKSDLYKKDPRKNNFEIIVFVRQMFSVDTKTGEPMPSEICGLCQKQDFCKGYMDTKYPFDKNLPDYPCDTDDPDILSKLAVELTPECEMYDDFDFSNCNDCSHCKHFVKNPDCDFCPAKKYCEGVRWAKSYDSDLICDFDSKE